MNKPSHIQLYCGRLPSKTCFSWTTLSKEEQERANRLRCPEKKNNWANARIMLRKTLSMHLPCAPEDIKFQKGKNGKPNIAYPKKNLQFNLSHSKHFCSIALSDGADIGVDIQYHKHNQPIEQLAKRIMLPAEWAAWENLPANKKNKAFFQCWTRKEAAVKMLALKAPSSFQLCPVYWPPLSPDWHLFAQLLNQATSRFCVFDQSVTEKCSLSVMCKTNTIICHEHNLDSIWP